MLGTGHCFFFKESKKVTVSVCLCLYANPLFRIPIDIFLTINLANNITLIRATLRDLASASLLFFGSKADYSGISIYMQIIAESISKKPMQLATDVTNLQYSIQLIIMKRHAYLIVRIKQ